MNRDFFMVGLPLEKSQEICIISEIALKVELAPIDFSLISY